ncbi:MAG: hypothetical protein ACLFTT_03510 [Candidatus Hydrogenedentota bacterium]
MRHIKAFSIDTGENDQNLGVILSTVAGILSAVGEALVGKENASR